MSEAQDSPLRGRLAQVIASRGGLAPPEAPFVIEHRDARIVGYQHYGRALLAGQAHHQVQHLLAGQRVKRAALAMRPPSGKPPSAGPG